MHGKGDTMTFDFELQWTGQYTLVLTSTLGLHVTFMFCFFFLWPSLHHSCCHPVIEAVTPEILRSRQGTTKWMKVVSFNNISRAVWPWLFTFLCILLMTWSVLKKKSVYLFIFCSPCTFKNIVQVSPTTRNLQGKFTSIFLRHCVRPSLQHYPSVRIWFIIIRWIRKGKTISP